jgi:hypothetical protein
MKSLKKRGKNVANFNEQTTGLTDLVSGRQLIQRGLPDPTGKKIITPNQDVLVTRLIRGILGQYPSYL